MTSRGREGLCCSGVFSHIGRSEAVTSATLQPDVTLIESLQETVSSSLSPFQNGTEEMDLECYHLSNVSFNTSKLGRKSHISDP